MSRIAMRRLIQARFATVAHGILATLSLVTLSFVGSYALRAAAESGFFEYLSILSDGGVVASYWREIVFAAAESLPAAYLASILALGAVAAHSLRGIPYDMRRWRAYSPA